MDSTFQSYRRAAAEQTNHKARTGDHGRDDRATGSVPVYCPIEMRRFCVPVTPQRWRIGLAVCILALAACKTAPIPAPVAPAETNSEKVTDEASKTLPPDLFKEMPIYPGARIEHVRKPTRMMREILFSTDAELSAIVAYYKEQLKKNNFEVSSTVIMRARKTWSCSFEKSGRPGNIMLYPSEQDKSRMTIAVMYELPTKNDLFFEPEEDFDVLGPGEIVQPPPNPSEKAMRK